MKTKFEITRKGVAGHQIGDIVEFEGEEVPGYLVNKGHPLTERVAITNPAEDPVKETAQERQELLAEAAKVLDADQFGDDGKPDVRAINSLLEDGVAKFSAAERDQLWPGIADAVKVAQG